MNLNHLFLPANVLLDRLETIRRAQAAGRDDVGDLLVETNSIAKELLRLIAQACLDALAEEEGLEEGPTEPRVKVATEMGYVMTFSEVIRLVHSEVQSARANVHLAPSEAERELTRAAWKLEQILQVVEPMAALVALEGDWEPESDPLKE